ncbi:MAG: hypothetical protein SFU98_22055 [Leptospiraceae bacterium]|nr:hypothetical protein [Leptospiraceae bacterium]
MISLQPNFIIDEKGKIQFAVIPYSQWNDLQKKIKKVETLEGIRSGLLEVKKSKQNRNKLSTLKDFLNES